MVARLILGLFTFWVGLASSISVPALSLKAEFQLTEQAKAQSTGAARQSEDAQCQALLSIIATKAQASATSLATASNIHNQEERASQTAIADEIRIINIDVEDPNNPHIARMTSATINKLDGAQGRVVSTINGIARPHMKAYGQAVFNLGKKAGCGEAYSAAAQQYNLRVQDFNTYAARNFPADAATYKKGVYDKQSSYESASGFLGLDATRRGVSAGVDSFIAQGNHQLKIAGLNRLPAAAAELPATFNPDQSTGDVKAPPLDPNSDTIDTPIGIVDDCGCAGIVESDKAKKAWYKNILPTLIEPLCGLVCLTLTAMVQAYIGLIRLAEGQAPVRDTELQYNAGNEGTFDLPPGTSPPATIVLPDAEDTETGTNTTLPDLGVPTTEDLITVPGRTPGISQ